MPVRRHGIKIYSKHLQSVRDTSVRNMTPFVSELDESTVSQFIIYVFFDVTTSVSFLRGSNTQLRDVTAGPFTAGPLSDVTPLQCTADPTPEPHGRTSSRGPSHSFLVVTSIATIGTFEATRFYSKLCIFIAMSMYSYCMFMYLHSASWLSSATLTKVFPCFSRQL